MRNSEETLRLLVRIPRLEELELDWCKGVTDSLLKEVGKANRLAVHLTYLVVREITSNGMQHLAGH